jgi:hypothetical protein
MPATLTAEQITDRARIVLDSDAVCDGCGCPVPESAIEDERWFIDSVLDPEGTEIAQVSCPACW